MRFPGRSNWKLVAAVAGIMATGVPMVLFNAWVKKQGEDESSITASWVLAAAERQVAQTIALLHDLSAQGIDSCSQAHREAMRRLVFTSGLVKEVALIASDGQAVCTDAGAAFGRQQAVGSASTSMPDVILEAVRIIDLGDRLLRVRKLGSPGKPSVAAVLPAFALLPQASLQSGRTLALARLILADGTVVGTSGTASQADYGELEPILVKVSSKPFGFAVEVAMDRNRIVADYEDLRRIGMVVTGLIALVILGIALMLRTRKVEDPIAELAKAILADEFVPYFQPVVDIQTGRLMGAEVVARWRRPDGTVVPPGSFIPELESSGLIIDLTRALMRRACREVGDEIGRHGELTIAFNVAPQHFVDALILNDVGQIFDGSPIKLKQVILELTERCEVENLTATRRTIAALQGLGCKVAIDDVGAGHSGLSYILKLGVDIIKIDKIFVDALGTESHSKAIIETMVDLARNMRMEVIAEGVETFDQLTYLRDHSIRAVQGYVFAPPLPAASFLQLVQAVGGETETAADGAAADRIARAA